MPRFHIIALAALSLTACSRHPSYFAEATLHGVHLKVSLTAMHPYLAEYRRFVEVTSGGKTERKEVFADSGGYAWIVVRARAGNLEVYDLGGVEFFVPAGGAPDTEQYLGRFDFDAQHNYVFIPASADRTDPSIPFRKGT